MTAGDPVVGSTERSPRRRTTPPVSGPLWRLIETAACPGARNMAVDMALAESVRGGGLPVLRFYRWWPACISFGRNQPARDHYDTEEAERRRIDFVRRPTGGRAVYHHHEVTYSVIIDRRLLGGPRRTYLAIHKALTAGLRFLDVPAEIADGHGPARRPSTLPCFREVDSGAIMVEGKKLVGSAQLTTGGITLQHGSILLRGDQSPTVELLRVRRESEMIDPPASLDELVPRLPTWHELVDALASGFERVIGMHLIDSILQPEELDRVEENLQRFRDPEWTWRR